MTVLLVILDATIVNIALPAVSADLEHQRGHPAVDRHRLHPDLRRLPAARRPDRRLLGPQAHLPRRRRRLRRRLGARRPGPERGDALRRPRAAGRLRRAAGPGVARADHRAVHRRQGAGQGLRRLRRDRRRRLGRRPAAGRRAHRVRRLALVLLGEPAGRGRSPSSLAIPIVPESRAPGDTQLRHPRRRAGHPGPGVVRLRLHPRRPGRRRRTPSRAAAATAAGPSRWRWRSSSAASLLVAAVRRPRAADPQPAAADAHRARPQPRRRVPDLDARRRRAHRGVLLPEPVLPAGARLRAGRGGPRLAADHAGRLHLGRRGQRPGAEGRARSR